jgi:hypothetical protein
LFLLFFLFLFLLPLPFILHRNPFLPYPFAFRTPPVGALPSPHLPSPAPSDTACACRLLPPPSLPGSAVELLPSAMEAPWADLCTLHGGSGGAHRPWRLLAGHGASGGDRRPGMVATRAELAGRPWRQSTSVTPIFSPLSLSPCRTSSAAASAPTPTSLVRRHLPAVGLLCGPHRGACLAKGMAKQGNKATLLQLRPGLTALESASFGCIPGETVLGHPLTQLHPKQLSKLLEKLCQTDPYFPTHDGLCAPCHAHSSHSE